MGSRRVVVLLQNCTILDSHRLKHVWKEHGQKALKEPNHSKLLADS